VARGVVGERDRAVDEFRRSVEILRSLGDRCAEAEVLNNWGKLLLTSGEPVAAREHFDHALTLARDIGCPLEEARALEGIDRYDWMVDGPGHGEGSLRAAVAVYRRLGVSTAVDDIERLLVSGPA
jgi:tetratricopeptide (TPR) repeat protein